MDRELRVLILEDDAADAELEEYELRRSGLGVSIEMVDTREAFEGALGAYKPDVILADYDLPVFNGLEALEIAKGAYPDVPFILVTGRIGEEFAIETLKKGVTDYVLKNNLKRLVPVIERALEESEQITKRKRAEEERDRILNLSNDLICIVGTDGYFRYVNPAWERVLGHSMEELLSRPFLNVIHPDDHPKTTEEFSKLTSNYRTYDFENRYVHKNGSIRVISWTATSLAEKGLVYCIGRDVTERRRIQEAIRRNATQWQNTFDSIKNLIMLLDKDFRIIRANTATRDFLGMPFDKIIGQYCFHLMHGTEEPPPECPFAKFKKTISHEESVIFLKERNMWISVTIDPIYGEKGEILQVVHIIEDITERKRLDQALQDKIQVAESWNKKFIGREMNMIELKKEVNSLLEQLGKPRKYMW